ncbi:putative septum formation protein Maf [Monocercomonoides exilis]|uniref:putative septum formation protein Maf n=1 Tax=Monocercomonoides exilis TaxID=2049356 RepID=UPI00355A022C|nr:putative septum formation protein Maf [Monocercomonoides exilis]
MPLSSVQNAEDSARSIEKMKIILASQSPQRKALLEEAGFHPTIIISNADEVEPKDGDVSDVESACCINAEKKAKKILSQISNNDADFLIAADSLVVVPGVMTAGKPKTIAQAHEMFQIFAEKEILAISGVHLIDLKTGKGKTFFETSKIVMNSLSFDERDALFERVTPLNKAGGFSIALMPELIKSIEGSRSNIEGLPMERIKLEMQKIIEARP